VSVTVAAAGAVTSGTTQTLATSAPSGVVAGSPLVLLLSVRDSATSQNPATPSGWTYVNQSGSRARVYAYFRYAAGDSSDAPTIDHGASPSHGLQSQILRFAGAAPSGALGANQIGAANGIDASIPTVSISESGSLVVSVLALETGGSAAAVTWPSPWDERADSWPNASVRHTFSTATAPANPSTSPGGTVSWGTSFQYGLLTLAITPAPASSVSIPAIYYAVNRR
jgi:hypothetical protein